MGQYLIWHVTKTHRKTLFFNTLCLICYWYMYMLSTNYTEFKHTTLNYSLHHSLVTSYKLR